MTEPTPLPANVNVGGQSFGYGPGGPYAVPQAIGQPIIDYITATLNAAYVGPSGLTVVNHGTVGTTARPAGANLVYWIGTVTPANALPYDFWYEG